jgi:hypothetical protein
MEASDVLKIVLREMTAYGTGWRCNWSDFDGRTLRNQLDSLAEWAESALRSERPVDFTRGTEHYRELCQVDDESDT